MQAAGPAPGAGGVPRSFVLAVTLTFTAACAAPYALAAARTPVGTTFSGILLNHFDQNYYQASQRSAAESLPERNRFTSEKGAPGPVAPLYPLLGHLQRWTRLPPLVAYHLPRLLAIVAFPALLTWFYGLCFARRRDVSMWAVVLALFVTGVLFQVPWLSVAERSGERIPESNVLLSFTVFPHFAVAHVGLTLGFGTLAMALRDRGLARTILLGVGASLLIGLSHTFLLLPLLGVLGVFLAASVLRGLRRRAGFVPTGSLAAVALALALPALPFVLSLRGESDHLEQLRLEPFPTTAAGQWWTWAVGFGVVAPLAVMGLLHLRRKLSTDPGLQILVVWITVQFGLVYSTITVFQRRYIEGVIVPVSALAAVGVHRARLGSISRRRAGAALVGLLAVGVVSAARVLSLSGQYIDDRYDKLWAHVAPSDVVLAGDDLSRLLPAFSSGSVFVARPVETIGYQAKMRARSVYAKDVTAAPALAWLRRSGITLVVVDRADTSFRPTGLQDPGAACLDPVVHGEGLDAYRVDRVC